LLKLLSPQTRAAIYQHSPLILGHATALLFSRVGKWCHLGRRTVVGRSFVGFCTLSGWTRGSQVPNTHPAGHVFHVAGAWLRFKTQADMCILYFAATFTITAQRRCEERSPIQSPLAGCRLQVEYQHSVLPAVYTLTISDAPVSEWRVLIKDPARQLVVRGSARLDGVGSVTKLCIVWGRPVHCSSAGGCGG
jgi:hypothetical protein